MFNEAVGLTLFPATMAFAAVSDLLTMTIANRISLILVVGFAVAAVLGGLNATVVLLHFAAAAAVLGLALLGFARGWIGGGDGKLAAATALWFGFGHLFDYLIFASMLGGALTLLIILFRTMPLPAVMAGSEWAERLHRCDSGIPYGIALAGAALIVYPQSGWMMRLAG
jgi:prepilin peptidase CpaA